jgi:hypothetical protein
LEQLTATAGYAIRATDSFAAWKAFHAGSDSIDSRITDFNGNMMYVWEPSNLVLKTNTLDLPVYQPSSQGQRIVTENAMPIVLDFSGGAKTVIIDISPRLASQNFFIFKNFEADDSFKFTYIGQSQKPDGSWTPSYDDFPHEIRSTNNFTNQAAFESSGKAMLASKTLGTGNALFIQDATLTFSDLPSSMVKSGVLSVTEPQKAEIRTVGVLALDVFSSEPRDVNYPIFDRYLGMGADGRADFLISFVGSLPSSMSVDLVFGPTLLAG